MPLERPRWWSRLPSWPTPAAPTGGAVAVTLYTRAGCCLCDEVMSALLDAPRERPVVVSIVDVDADPALRLEFGDHVPVVAIDGRPRFRGRFPLTLLERALAAPRSSNDQT